MAVWATFWGCLLIAVLLVFAILSVAVAVGGFFDVMALFKDMDQQHDDKSGAGGEKVK